MLHRSQALASTMATSRRVAVAGANGKTTTTSMLTVALQHCGADPSFAAGGELAKHGTNAHWGSGDIFVAEADESDGSFLVYRPEVAIVTNVQPDHLDFYGTFENVQRAYGEFTESVLDGGLLVACHDDAGSLALAEAARAAGHRVLTYGWSADADVVLAEPVAHGLMSRATLRDADGRSHTLRINIPGRHNLLNATAAFTAATAGLGQDPVRILDGLFGFTGTRRRFEPKGTAAGVSVVDDYAHNPGKVAAVVGTGAELVAGQGASSWSSSPTCTRAPATSPSSSRRRWRLPTPWCSWRSTARGGPHSRCLVEADRRGAERAEARCRRRGHLLVVRGRRGNGTPRGTRRPGPHGGCRGRHHGGS